MEKENVLEIEFKELWDNNFAWRVTKQNEEILGRNVFKDEELNVESFESPEFRKAESKLFIKGYVRTYDYNIQICTSEEKALIEEKVKAINEKYGIKKRWRAENGEIYYYINEFFEINWIRENNNRFSNKKYESGNHFKTETEAKEYIEYLKQKSLEWHESRENNE